MYCEEHVWFIKARTFQASNTQSSSAIVPSFLYKPEKLLHLQLLPGYPGIAAMTKWQFHPHLDQVYLQAELIPKVQRKQIYPHVLQNLVAL